MSDARALTGAVLLLAVGAPPSRAVDPPAAPAPGERDAALDRAHASVAEAARRVKDDPARPIYHLLPPAQWMNDPNGPIYHQGAYHLFYQFNPYGDEWGHMHWGHFRSRDLVRWEHLPIALWPSLSRGEEHCFSGCAVTDPRGRLVLVYTSISPKRPPEQWAAVAEDAATTVFGKHPANPLLTLEAHGGLPVEDWRDPFVFREAGRWYMVVGGHVKGRPGGIFLYASDDLERWQFLGAPFEGTETNWECPLLFRAGSRWVLIYSPHGEVRYHVGRLDLRKPRFVSELQGTVAHGPGFYAPNLTRDPGGRWLMWGWIRGFPKKQGWNGAMTVPRVLSVGRDGHLGQQPAAELAKLRGPRVQVRETQLAGAQVLDAVRGPALDLSVKLTLGSASRAGLRLRRSADGTRGVTVSYDGEHLVVGSVKVPLGPPAAGRRISLRLLLDHSVLEVFTGDGRQTVAEVVRATAGDDGVELFSEGGQATASVDAWTMGTIWPAAH